MEIIQFLLENYGLTGLVVGAIVAGWWRSRNVQIEREKAEIERFKELADKATEAERLLREDMARQIGEHKAQTGELTRKVDAYRSEAEETRTALQQVDRDALAFKLQSEAEMRELRRQLDETRSLYKGARARARNLKIANNRLVADTQDLGRSNTNLSNKIGALRKKNQALEAEVGNLRKQVGMLQRAIRKLRVEMGQPKDTEEAQEKLQLTEA